MLASRGNQNLLIGIHAASLAVRSCLQLRLLAFIEVYCLRRSLDRNVIQRLMRRICAIEYNIIGNVFSRCILFQIMHGTFVAYRQLVRRHKVELYNVDLVFNKTFIFDHSRT